MKKQAQALGISFFSLFAFALFCRPTAGMPQAQAQEAAEKDLAAKFQAAESEYEKAKLFIQQQKMSSASQRLEECFSLLPEHSEAHYLAAQISYREGRLEEARAHMEKAEQFFGLTVQLRAKHSTAKSSELMTRKAQLEKDIAAIQDFLADSSLNLTEEEVAMYRKAISENQQKLAIVIASLFGGEAAGSALPADYFYFHGNVLFRIGRLPEAEEKYLAALKTDSKHVQAINNLANIYYVTRRYEEARKLLEEAEKQNLKVNEELKKAVLRSLGR